MGHESRLELPRPVAAESYVLTVDVSPFTDAPAPPAQRVTVVINGEVLRLRACYPLEHRCAVMYHD